MNKQEYEFEYEVYESIDDLTEEDKWLLDEAREVTQHAYAPYSRFQVGAVAKLSNGEIVAGSNQENASFPAGLCAERVVLASVSSLYPKMPIETIAISYNNNNGESNHPISPCGICRQVIAEFFTPDAPIASCNHLQQQQSWTLEQLLPAAFTPTYLANSTKVGA